MRQTAEKEDYIPIITTPIEIISCFNKYCIGASPKSFYLMYEISFHKAKTASSAYSAFCNYLLSNNQKKFHLPFLGVYLNKMFMKHYLVFDHPMYHLINASRSPSFNKLSVISSFIQLLNEMTREELQYLFLIEDLIFFSERKELLFVHLGNLTKIKLPSFKEIWKAKLHNKKEMKEDTKVDHLIKFIYSLYYVEDEEVDVETIWNSNASLLKNWNYQAKFPQEISALVDSVYQLLKTKISENELWDQVQAKIESQREKCGNEVQRYFTPQEKERLTIEKKPFSDCLLNAKQSFSSIENIGYGDCRNKKKQCFLQKGLLLMLKHFPLNNSKCKNIYYTEITKYSNNFLTSMQIPIVNAMATIVKNQQSLPPKPNQHSPQVKEDNWLRFKYSSNSREIFFYHISYSPCELPSPMIVRYLQQSKSIWPQHSNYSYSEDISLKFLALCNYDVYKALFSISYLHPLFIQFIIKENH